MALDQQKAGWQPRRSADVHTVPVDGESVLWQDQRATLHHLDEAATALWALLDGTNSVRDIGLILAAGNVEETKVQRDLLRLLDEMCRQDLVLG